MGSRRVPAAKLGECVMGKLVGLLLIVAVAAGAYYMMNQDSSEEAPVAKKENKEALKPEEKVGVSTGLLP